MSQRGDLREDLGRWLQDSVSVQWSNTVVNRYLNLALREVEKHILAVDPEAFKCVYTAATTVPASGADNIYSYPVGTFAVFEIGLSSDGANYIPLQRLGLKNIRDARQGLIGSVMGFAPFDARHFILWPSASTAVASALRAIVAPTLVMATDDDENPLPPAFESLLMKQAQKLCLYDVGEPVDAVQKEIDEMKKDTPRFYLTVTEPAFIVPLMPGGRYPQ